MVKIILVPAFFVESSMAFIPQSITTAPGLIQEPQIFSASPEKIPFNNNNLQYTTYMNIIL